MATKTYIPGQVTVVIGAVIIDNWESLNVTFEEDTWSFHHGSGDEMTRIKNNNRQGVIAIELPQTSSFNAQLTAIHDSDSTVSVEVLDGSGNSLYAMPEGSVMKIPDSPFSKNEMSMREWNVGGRLEAALIGGN